jgi:hypothetical protein
MRKLSEQELDQVKRAIAAKELTSAEILMEVYDHYVSHLEGFEEAEFEVELFELEQKFTYGYCHGLQARFNKEVRKDIGKLQWIVLKRNFCLPRILYVLGFMSVAFYLSSNIGSGKEAAILMVVPLLILTVFHLYFLVRSSIRIKVIKRSLNYKNLLQSSLFYPLAERMYLPVMMSYSIVWISDTMFASDIISNLGPQIAALFSILLFIYMISIVEVCKIKSKTALL